MLQEGEKPMIGKLIWKEWSEQRWKLFLGCVLLGGFTAIGLQARIIPDMGMVVAALFYAFIFPLFVSMDLVAAERADGTLGSLLSLPVTPWKILIVKTGMGLVSCIGPLVLTAALVCVIAGGREVPVDEFLHIYAGCACFTVAMFVWMLAFSVRQPTEARAAVAGMFAFAFLLLPLLFYMPLQHVLPKWVKVFHPFSLFLDPSDMHWLAIIIPVQVTMTVGLFCWAALRLTRERRTA